MEQEVREMLAVQTAERRAVLDQIAAGWSLQTRRPSAKEIDQWITMGRP